MSTHRESKVAAMLCRIPVPLIGLLIAASSLQASCGGVPDADVTEVTDARIPADAGVVDAPSDDSPEDRADGMSYGDGYGK
jgi:hypothetical protein